MNTFFLSLLAPIWLCQAQDMPTSARFSEAFVSSSVCFSEMFTMEGTVWSEWSGLGNLGLPSGLRQPFPGRAAGAGIWLQAKGLISKIST